MYNYIHIGNARPAIVFDTVRRYLEFRGYDVEYVSNFTDVDDKLIKAAKELGEDVPTIANRFIDAYFEDTSALGCKHADVHPRVTENMDIIIEFIDELVKKVMHMSQRATYTIVHVSLKDTENYHISLLMNCNPVLVSKLEKRKKIH